MRKNEKRKKKMTNSIWGRAKDNISFPYDRKSPPHIRIYMYLFYKIGSNFNKRKKYLKSNACVYESWIRFFFYRINQTPISVSHITVLIRFGLNLVLCIASQSMEWSGPGDFDSWSLTNNRIFLWRLIKTLDYM